MQCRASYALLVTPTYAGIWLQQARQQVDQSQMNAPPLPPARAKRLARSLAVFGPGLVVMLADTDVGSIITAGQSGVQWGYRLLVLQLVLVPILYMVQELRG